MKNIVSEISLRLDDYYKAFHDKDWEIFGDCLADNFRYYTDNAVVMDKAGYVDFLKQNTWHGIEYRISDLEIHVPESCDMGVAVYKTFFKGLVNNKVLNVSAVETTVFIIEKNEWKILHTHISNKV